MKKKKGNEKRKVKKHRKQKRTIFPGSVQSGHLIKAPVVFSQLWQASTLRGIKELPQNLHNSSHIPCRMIPIFF